MLQSLAHRRTSLVLLAISPCGNHILLYVITDLSGNGCLDLFESEAARNQQLSDERADAVVTILQQDGVPLRHIVTPAAMGTADPMASNNSAEGRDLNQRVEVKLLVNRGVNATSSSK